MIRAIPSVSRRLAFGALVLYIALMVGTVGFSLLCTAARPLRGRV